MRLGVLAACLAFSCSLHAPGVVPVSESLVSFETRSAVLIRLDITARMAGAPAEHVGDAYCTGVVIGPHVIATAAHCARAPELDAIDALKGATYSVEIFVSQPDSDVDPREDSIREVVGLVAAKDDASDVALLEIADAVFDGPFPILRTGDVAVGEHVSSVNHANVHLDTYAEGYIANTRMMDPLGSGRKSPFLQVGIHSGHGASGGGLFDDQGRLLGVCSFTDGSFFFWAKSESLASLIANAVSVIP